MPPSMRRPLAQYVGRPHVNDHPLNGASPVGSERESYTMTLPRTQEPPPRRVAGFAI